MVKVHFGDKICTGLSGSGPPFAAAPVLSYLINISLSVCSFRVTFAYFALAFTHLGPSPKLMTVVPTTGSAGGGLSTETTPFMLNCRFSDSEKVLQRPRYLGGRIRAPVFSSLIDA